MKIHSFKKKNIKTKISLQIYNKIKMKIRKWNET